MTISVFAVTKSVDLSAKDADDYIQDSIAVIETIYGFSWGQKSYTMTINDVKFNDALFDPFNATTDGLQFLDFKKSQMVYYGKNNLQLFEIELMLDSSVRHLTRTRYSLWAALADIGGFFDGLGLLVRIFMGPLSAILFINDSTKGGHFLPKMSSSKKGVHRNIHLSARYPEDMAFYSRRLAPYLVT